MRITKMLGWPDGTDDVTGASGMVVALSPGASGGWSVSVQLPDEVWDFDEVELSLLADELSTRQELFPLIVEFSVAVIDGERAARDGAASLRQLLDAREMSVVAHHPLGEPISAARVEIKLQPTSDAPEAFERLIEHVGRPPSTVFDDGWAAEAHWGPEPLQAFGVDASIFDVVVALRPWDDPARRPLELS